ncbi:MAG: LysR family transcriptional regulator [Eubacteriales bacterium]|nr:LysR family transcriptional regulator [Eubacteriales bacterium]
MDTKQLATFVMLTEEKTYARAAARLNYAPATMAAHMKALENELGARLFCRTGKQSTLTPQGEAFLQYARKMLALQQQAVDDMHAGDKQRKALRVATAESLGHYALLALFRHFATEHGSCEMQVRVGNCAEFLRQLTDNQIDLAYIYSTDPVSAPHVRCTPLYEEKICILSHPQHPLARKAAVCARDLADQHFSFTYGNCCYTMAFLRQLQQQDVELKNVDYLGNVEMIKRCVLDNYGIALLPDCATREERVSGRMVELAWAGEPLRVRAQALSRAGMRPNGYAARLLACTSQYFAEREA